MKKLVHGSTFSGIGAPEVAAEMLGWRNAFHCEINPFGRSVLDYYYPESKSYEDITKQDFSEWGGRIDVLTGGFPCQPFSYAGKRRGSEDDRYLWPYMLKCIQQIRPTWFIGENVGGIGTMVFPGEDVKVGDTADLFDPGDIYRKEERYVITEICENLEREGYSVQPMLIPACAVGAPHRRDRVFFIAHRNDTENTLFSRFVDGRNEEQGSPRNEWHTSTGGDEWVHRKEGISSPDTDCRNDVTGITGEDEGKGREERLSERHSVRKPVEPADVRSKMQGTAADSKDMLGNGGIVGQCRGSETISEFGDSDSKAASTDSSSIGGNKVQCDIQSGTSDVAEPFGNGREWDASDTGSERLERENESRSGERKQWMQVWRDIAGYDRQDGEGEYSWLLPCNRWRSFPTVSAVYRGNDGFPFDVDNLTIPFTKWKTESLKAYGNAIVVQVMYEIFRAIDIIENNQELR